MNARMDALRDRLGGVAFAGDYNPEQWDRSVWDDDIRLMRRAGVNLVTLGVFGWASLEPAPGRFTFGWLDDAMDLLHAGGISVDLATPTAAPPVWLSHDHPEVLPVIKDGAVFGFGNRLHFDPTSDFLFLLNHCDTQTAVVPVDGVDLLTGEPTGGSLTLAPLAVSVIEMRRS